MSSFQKSLSRGMTYYHLESWDVFPRFVVEELNDPSLIFRGQGDARWGNGSSLDRLERRFPAMSHAREQHFNAFKEAVRGKRESNIEDMSEDEWWALAQHHGLASPLLDWTYSPFVALFFAFEDVMCADLETGKSVVPEERCICAIPWQAVEKLSSPPPRVFTPRRGITHRLGTQAGVLMHMPRGKTLEDLVAEHEHGILTKIIIPNEGRIDCLRLLNKMNINRMSLFPDLDGAAAYINTLWELEFDTPLGALPEGE